MIRTKHALLAVGFVLAVLIGLLIAATVSAPAHAEPVTQPAAIFAAESDGAYEVSVVPRATTSEARTRLIEAMRSGAGEGTGVREEYLYPPQPVVPTYMPVTNTSRPTTDAVAATTTADSSESHAEEDTDAPLAEPLLP